VTKVPRKLFFHAQRDRDRVQIRETREGWPLLSVENYTNGDSKSTNELGPSLVDSLDFSC
jgi:hypothetical protein